MDFKINEQEDAAIICKLKKKNLVNKKMSIHHHVPHAQTIPSMEQQKVSAFITIISFLFLTEPISS